MSDIQQSGERHAEELPIQQPANGAPSIKELVRPASVFLSYARKDAEIVRELQLRLKARGIFCWRDVDNLPVGKVFEGEIVHEIEEAADGITLLLTPDFLASKFIWQVEIPSALKRHKSDPLFHITPILYGVSIDELEQHCLKHNLESDALSRFNAILFFDDPTASITEEIQRAKWNDAANRILRAALAQRLRHIKAGHNYEPPICLKTFDWTPPKTHLDLDLDWSPLIQGKKRLSTQQEWEHIFFPALLAVKQSISEQVRSHRLHVFIKSILPVAIALGFAFRKSAGITLLLEGKEEIWSTDTLPSKRDSLSREWLNIDQEDRQVAVVEVGTSRSIKQSVAGALPMLGLTPGYHVRLESPRPSDTSVKNAAHAHAIAKRVKSICQELCDKHGVTHIHLFVAVPVQLAVLIGQQLNALCPITLYEYSQGAYTPVGLLVSE